MIQAVIFDMDGVIIDSEPINSKSWEILLIERGIKPIYNNQGLIHEIGPVGDDNYKVIMERHNIKEDVAIIRKRRREIFVKLLEEKLTPAHGFFQLIKMLKKENIRTAVASNRFIDHVYLMLSNLRVKEIFEVIVGPKPNIKPKPAPDIYLETARKLKVSAKSCVVLEDSETGVISAKKAGMKTIAIITKYTKHHNFSKADIIVNRLSQITIPMLQSL